MLSAFLLGYFFGVGSFAAACDIRRAFASAQQREQQFQQDEAKRLGRGHQ